MAQYKWYNHPVFFLKHDGEIPTLSLMEIKDKVEAHWAKEHPKSIFTKDEIELLNQLETLLIQYSMRYEDCQDKRCNLRSLKGRLEISEQEINKQFPLVSHWKEIGNMDAALLNQIGRKMPGKFGKSLMEIKENDGRHIDAWLHTFSLIRNHSRARYLLPQ